EPEVPVLVVARKARRARARVHGDEREAERRRHALRARLEHERLFGAGQPRQIIERRHARARERRRRQVHAEAHRPRARRAVVLVEALPPVEGAMLGARLHRAYSTTARIDSPLCMSSNASLIFASGSLCVISGSIWILPSMYQSTMRGTSVRPRAPPKAEPFHTRPVTSWNGRVAISCHAPATPMITETPQ